MFFHVSSGVSRLVSPYSGNVKLRYVRDTLLYVSASSLFVVQQDSENTPESFGEGKQCKKQTRQGSIISNQLEM